MQIPCKTQIIHTDTKRSFKDPDSSRRVEEIGITTKNLLRKKIPNPKGFTGQYHRMCIEQISANPCRVSENGGGKSSPFTLRGLRDLVPDKDTTRKGNYSPTTLMITHAKTLNKMLTNKAQ